MLLRPLKTLFYSLPHPEELLALATYTLESSFHRNFEQDEATGYSRPEMRWCWDMLDNVGRSYAAVVKQLDGEMCRVVCLFYLVLRGLDTIEDDMSIGLKEKCRLLETFHENLDKPGWTYTGNGPHEKDRQLLVEFDKVLAELGRLENHYTEPITRICKEMGHGMSHYIRAAAGAPGSVPVNTLGDHDLYCHYVAGIVGEGLSALFSASGKETPELGKVVALSNSMGLMLQKTNIIRDFREDAEAGRLFWPKAIWGKYTDDSRRFYQEIDSSPEMSKKAMHALSEMILNALFHVPDCLDYLSMIQNQSIFDFCAIPQIMAMATLEKCFMNPNVFKEKVKIRKSLAILLIQEATTLNAVADIFLQYGRKIVNRARPSDPNYEGICSAVGGIELWTKVKRPNLRA